VLRDIRAAGSEVPVVMVTGVRTVVTAVEAMRLGAFDYLTKPFEEEELFDVVGRALAHHARLGRARGRGERSASPRSGVGAGACLIIGGSPGWRIAMRLVLHGLGLDAFAKASGEDVSEIELRSVQVIVFGPTETLKSANLLALAPTTLFIEVVNSSPVEPSQNGARAVDQARRLGTAKSVGDVINRVVGVLGDRGQSARVGQHASKAVEYFAAHYGEAITLTSVAEALRISESHLAHTFHSEIGYSPKQFVTALRLGVADLLLVEQDAKVGNIARRVGFFDASHLSRALRQREQGGARGRVRDRTDPT
jgi:AraC-like DNA-binding protein